VTAGPIEGARSRLTERKFVTVMFIDMVGSLSVIRDKDPEDAHAVLASALEVMTQAVHAHGGVVVDRTGDGIMAIFGAPTAQEDHATRACHAALRLHRLVAHTLADRIALRVGMNSGEVAVGSASSDFSIDYTATGAVVHIAARLQGIAPSNATVMTAQTAALVRDEMLTEPLGRQSLKGLADPIELHRLVGPASAGDRTPRPMQREFVGRAAELGFLDEALARGLDARGCVCGLSGDAGIGKTALIDRFAHRHRSTVTVISRMPRCAVSIASAILKPSDHRCSRNAIVRSQSMLGDASHGSTVASGSTTTCAAA